MVAKYEILATYAAMSRSDFSAISILNLLLVILESKRRRSKEQEPAGPLAMRWRSLPALSYFVLHDFSTFFLFHWGEKAACTPCVW